MTSSEGLGRNREAASSAEDPSRSISPHPAPPEPQQLAGEPKPVRPPRDRFWRDALLRRLLALADLAGATAATAVIGTATHSAVWAFAMLPAWIVIAKLLSLYDRDQRSIRHLTVDELPAIAALAAAGVAMLGLVLPLTPGG